MFRRERPIETHFQHANFFAARQQLINNFLAGANGRSHQHNDPFRLRMAVILKGFVFPTRCGSKVIHRLFNMVVNRVVPRVGGLAGLEIGIRVRRRAANHRVFRIQGAGAMRVDIRLREEIQDCFVSQRDDFVNFVRGAETIKEMNKRHPAFERGDMRY